VEFRETGKLPWLTDYRSMLETLITVASKTHQDATDLFRKRRGRPMGAGGNPAFDEFVKNLYEAARKSGGRWTLSRDPIAPRPKWTGTLSEGLEILRPYLPPEKFFPAAKLGFVLERLSKRFRPDTAKIRRAP
jgi:hypothetical protein